ncbi:MAG: hypothetical protein H7251_14045 [Acetobacteraceae bacterium]|nr:hypothetical protein [Acetobacteraceae bacterium]
MEHSLLRCCLLAEIGRLHSVKLVVWPPAGQIKKCWERRFFADILALSGDSGARKLLETHAEAVAEIDLGDDAILRDFHTMESLATLPPKLRPVTEVAT